MPPQIGGVGGGSGTTVQQVPSPEGQKVESKDTQKTEVVSSTSKSNETTSTPTSQGSQQLEDSKAAARASQGSKENATVIKSQQNMQAQVTQKNLEKKLSEAKTGATYTVADLANDMAKANPKARGDKTANSNAVRLANEANAHVMKGMNDARAIDLAHKANAHVMNGIGNAQKITSQRDIALQKKGEELGAELKQVASGKPSFEESERMIKKIDDYKREVDAAGGNDVYLHRLYHQEIAKPTRMETREFGPIKYEVKSKVQDEPVNTMQKVLGVYGYSPIHKGYIGEKTPGVLSGTEAISQYDVLDTALHNWRATPENERKMLHGLASPPVNLPPGWKTPIDTRTERQYRESRQIVLQNEPQGNYMAPPIARERENQTDPNTAFARGQKEVLDGGVTILGSMGHAGGSKSPRASEPIGPASAPHRGAPPEPISAAETQPGPGRSTPPPPPSEPVNPGGGGPTAPRSNTIISHPPPMPNPAPSRSAGQVPSNAAAGNPEPPQPAKPQSNASNIGQANTEVAPARQTAGAQTGALNQAQAQRAAENIAAENAGAAGYRTTIRPFRGPIQELSAEQALTELARGNIRVVRSDSTDFHRLAWETARGESRNEQIPIAFRTGDQVRVDFTRLTPAERQRYIELDMQLNPNDYPPQP